MGKMQQNPAQAQKELNETFTPGQTRPVRRSNFFFKS